MSTKHRKVKRKFLLSMEELKIIDNMMQSDDVESRLLGLSLLETSALGKHYFNKGKIKPTGERLVDIVNKLRMLLHQHPITLVNDINFQPIWLQVFMRWIKSKTY